MGSFFLYRENDLDVTHNREYTSSDSMDNSLLPINKIIEGDCLQVMKSWPDHCVDHCITDPPFNLSKKKGLSWAFSSHVTMQEAWDIFSKDEFLKFTGDWIQEVTRVVKPNGNIFIFGSYHNIYIVGFIIQQLNLKLINSIVWFKPNAQPNITTRMLTESTEHIIWACNNNVNKATKWVFNYDEAKRLGNGRQLRNVWEIPYTPAREKTFGKNPTQKPEALLERLILIGSLKNEIVLDCFAGTGTTAVVAERLGRQWIAIEKDATYVDIAQRRMAAEKSSQNVEIQIKKLKHIYPKITQPNLLEKRAEYIKE